MRKFRCVNVKHFVLRRKFIWRNRIEPAPRFSFHWTSASGWDLAIWHFLCRGPWTVDIVDLKICWNQWNRGLGRWDSAGAGMSHCDTRVTRISLFAFAVRVPKTETIQSVDLRMMGTFPSVQPSTNINLRNTSSLV